MKKSYISPNTTSVVCCQVLLNTASEQVQQLNNGGIGTPEDLPTDGTVTPNSRHHNVWDDEEANC